MNTIKLEKREYVVNADEFTGVKVDIDQLKQLVVKNHYVRNLLKNKLELIMVLDKNYAELDQMYELMSMFRSLKFKSEPNDMAAALVYEQLVYLINSTLNRDNSVNIYDVYLEIFGDEPNVYDFRSKALGRV